MASSSGTSSGNSLLFRSSGSEENLQALMDQRKRKRMMSNRESARRSRMRKKMHLDDLRAQLVQTTKEKQEIITSMNITTQQYLKLEAENSILKAQVSELTHRLQSMNDIVHFLKSTKANGITFGHDAGESNSRFLDPSTADSLFQFMNSIAYLNLQPIMASADMGLY